MLGLYLDLDMNVKREGLYIEYTPLSKLKKYKSNPKMHALKEIGESIDRFGFAAPPTIDEETGYLVAGHGRVDELGLKQERGENPPTNVSVSDSGEWLIPVVRGNRFKDEAELEAYLLTDNKLIEKGGWDEDMLAARIPVVKPIGFDYTAIRNKTQEAFSEVQTPDFTGVRPTKTPGEKGVADARLDLDGLKRGASLNTKDGDTPDFDAIPGILQGVYEISENLPIYSTGNSLGIPELDPDMILQEFPKPIQTWGGKGDTPDDGESYYFYNFGSTPTQGLPYSRAIMSYFTADRHIETFWNNPPYRVGQKLVSGIIACVVPDCSIWEEDPRILQMYNVYRAQWLGRFMQDAGVQIVPRFEYFLPEVRDFALIGVPKDSPTLATQLHTSITDETIPRIKDSLLKGLDIVRPGQLLVYASEKGEEILNDIRQHLPVQELIVLPNAKRVRRPKESWKEEDPYLLKLRKMKYERREKEEA
jgi:hypothetical protein